jgi:tRNA dimethylallyltransferase
MKPNTLVCIVGPTASGKTHLAVRLAYILDGEIISADSRQVYRKMDIGTGKDLDEYCIGKKQIPYHLIDIVDPGFQYDVYKYGHDFQNAYQNILSRKKVAILCGGSGMYIESIVGNYGLEYVPINNEFRKQAQNESVDTLIDMLKEYKTLHNTTDSIDRERLIRAMEIALYSEQHPPLVKSKPIPYKIFCLSFKRAILRERIALRLQERLDNGMIEEVQSLLDSGVSEANLYYYGLEYRFISQYIQGKIDYKTMAYELRIAIGQFAKRQQTWFNRMRYRGFAMIDIDGSLSEVKQLEQILHSIHS